MWALLGLTVLSGFLCFNRLSVPPLLIDECFTFWRVCGNLDQLLDTLRNDAFMPLHYEVINWIGQGFPLGWGVRLVPGGIPLTPMALRFFPALCGTLMTPVMYFLARQMFNRRTAVYAAAFMACSAYSLFFSRNAKMYADAWMFETLMIACFLWWIRTWRRDAWLCWMAAGVAAAGVHVITLLVLPLAPLYFISVGQFSKWRVPMLVLGMAVIAAGPAVYYGVFNRWTQNSGGIVPGVGAEPAPDANWQASGLNWIPSIEDSLQAPMEALNTYLSGYEWDTLEGLHSPPQYLKRFRTAMVALAAVTYGLLILGALPWPHLRGVRTAEPGRASWWRGLLWLATWLVLPVYCFFYCRSVDDFSSPLDWLKLLRSVAGPYWWAELPALIGVVAVIGRWPRIAPFLAIGLLLAAIAALVDSARGRWDWLNYAAFPAVQILLMIFIPALLFHFSGGTFRERTGKLFRFLAIAAVILILCEGAALTWRWLHDRSLRLHPDLPWQSIWHYRYVGIVMPAVWLAAAALIGRLPTRALQIAAVVMICGYNLANGVAHQYTQTEVPLDRAVAEIYESQPDSNVRTYFDLRTLFDDPFYRPLASYSACMAAGLRPTPTEFRDGNRWPFQWGRVATEFKQRCIYNPTISATQIHDDTTAHPKVTRVITWQIGVAGLQALWFGDPVTQGLGSGWEPVSDESIVVHYTWTWMDQWVLRRREFRRKSVVATNFSPGDSVK
jgi:hypothetical protein